MRARAKRGFTLIEILIVVVILGILAAIVIPQFTDASQDAAESSIKSQLQTVRSQIELYRVKAGGVAPTAISDLVTPGDLDGDGNDESPFLQKAPVLPPGYAWDDIGADGILEMTTCPTGVTCTDW